MRGGGNSPLPPEIALLEERILLSATPMPAVIDSATTVEVVDATLSDDVGSAIAQPNFEFTKVDIRTDIPTSTSSKTALCTQENVGIVGDSVFANSQEIIKECFRRIVGRELLWTRCYP